MNRRLAIQRIAIISAGTALLPSCLHSDARTTLTLKKLSITAGQQQMLASLAQLIIPTTDTMGAREMKSHEFALKMIDDCYSPEEQQKFMSGLNRFEELSKKRSDKKFIDMDKANQQELLTYVEDKKNASEEASTFYRTIKGLTLQSYTGSEFYMTSVMKYNIIPKPYKGCVAVS